MMINRRFRKYISTILSAALALSMSTQASADTLTPTNTTGTINVYANVTSDYQISLPASISLTEMDVSFDTDNPDLYFGAEMGTYQVGVKGALLGEKVTLMPKGGTDAEGRYSFSMQEATFDGSGAPTLTPGGEFLTVKVAEPKTEWIPSNGTVTDANRQQKISNDDFVYSDFSLITTTPATVGKAYSGALTFTVTCEDT